MIADLDIWRGANLLVKQHSEDASLMAAQHADEMLGRGVVEGQVVWRHILRAVDELMATNPPGLAH